MASALPAPSSADPPPAASRAARGDHATTDARATERDRSPARYAWAAARIGLGWIFLWAFLDKLLGLGRATPSGQSWLDGGNPTKGYLSSAEGPFAGIFHDMAGGWLVNVLFMAGLLAVGLALMLGVARLLATVGGVLLVLLMWASHLPPADNPFLDDHLIYAVVLIGLALAGADRTLGLGDRWGSLALVRRVRWLR